MRSETPVPFRRTARTLLFGGLALLAVVVAVGLVADTSAQQAGPGHQARWRAGETAALFRPIRPGSPRVGTWFGCSVDGQRVQVELRGDMPPAGVDRTVTCDVEVVLLQGAPLAVSHVVRGELIMLPVAMVVVGGYLFFPRLLWFMAWFSTPKAVRPGGGRA